MAAIVSKNFAPLSDIQAAFATTAATGIGFSGITEALSSMAGTALKNYTPLFNAQSAFATTVAAGIGTAHLTDALSSMAKMVAMNMAPLTGMQAAFATTVAAGIDTSRMNEALSSVANTTLDRHKLSATLSPSFLANVASLVDQSRLLSEVQKNFVPSEYKLTNAIARGLPPLLSENFVHGIVGDVLGRSGEVIRESTAKEENFEGHGSTDSPASEDMELWTADNVEGAIQILALALLMKFVVAPLITLLFVTAAEGTFDLTNSLIQIGASIQAHSPFLSGIEFWAFVFSTVGGGVALAVNLKKRFGDDDSTD
jgi:hypothetical protein